MVSVKNTSICCLIKEPMCKLSNWQLFLRFTLLRYRIHFQLLELNLKSKDTNIVLLLLIQKDDKYVFSEQAKV